MCWHYHTQELQLFNLQVVPLRLVHDIRLGLWAAWHLQLQLLLWVLLSLVNFGVYDIFKWERHSREYLFSQGYSEYPLASFNCPCNFEYKRRNRNSRLALVQNIHFENWTNFRMDMAGFESWTLSIELAIDWRANTPSHHGLVKDLFCFETLILKFENQRNYFKNDVKFDRNGF